MNLPGRWPWRKRIATGTEPVISELNFSFETAQVSRHHDPDDSPTQLIELLRSGRASQRPERAIDCAASPDYRPETQ